MVTGQTKTSATYHIVPACTQIETSKQIATLKESRDGSATHQNMA
jgi:hypothetical protein